MEIRAFAERLLFTSDLDEKLAPPGRLTDDHPGPPGRVPAFPGRPVGLRPTGARARFPTPAELDDDARRGHVLHFFANHELLATELMALMLLRFPDAPPAFRRGLVHTISEEQRHLRMYRDRMADFGVTLGEIPVNAFFWDAIADVPAPKDFVARMSLTFEQANLDHSLRWMRAFREIGDHETADLLDVVYREEIAHVGFGLRWFDRWRDPDTSLWDAWASSLEIPLSPSRAKGPELDRAGRHRAGLPDDFVDRLAVHVTSKGRPPAVHLFNPDCEAEVARGRPGHTPSAAAAALARDLATLPALTCAHEDLVLTDAPPAPAFLASLQRAGFRLPEFAREVVHPHVGDLCPWGWSPDAHARLAPLRDRLVGTAAGWSPALRELSSKAWAADRLRELDVCDPDVVGVPCTDLDAVRAAVDRIDAPALLKLPFSTSGRGRRRVRAPLTDADSRWLQGALARQGAVVVEPWLERVVDLSVQFTVLPDGDARIDGLVRFFTDGGGRFRGCVVGRHDLGLPPELRRWLHRDGASPRWVERRLEGAARALAARMGDRGFVGPAGVDAMIHRRDGDLHLKPIVELNPRRTMGRVALSLRDRLAPTRVGLWLVVGRRDAEAAGHPDLASLAADLRARLPLVTAGDRIASGALWTTDPTRAEAFATLLVVDRTLEACRDALPPPLRPATDPPGPAPQPP